MYVVVGAVILAVGLFLRSRYHRDIKKYDQNLEREYTKALSRVYTEMLGHPSRRKSVLGKSYVRLCNTSREPAEILNDLADIANEVPSRAKSPMGRMILQEQERINKLH